MINPSGLSILTYRMYPDLEEKLKKIKSDKIFLLLLLLMVTGLFSCEDEAIKYPVTYTCRQIAGIDIRVFSGSGEITDPGTTDQVIKMHKKYITDLESLDVVGKLEVIYLSIDSVEITLDGLSEGRPRLVRENNGITFWERDDTLEVPINPGFDVNTILLLHPLFFEIHDVPNVSGYDKVARYKPCFFIYRTGEKLEFPVFDFLHWSDMGYHSYNGFNNDFNEDYLSTLDVADTLIVQSYYFVLQ